MGAVLFAAFYGTLLMAVLMRLGWMTWRTPQPFQQDTVSAKQKSPLGSQLVSVLIPARNEEGTIATAVSSILASVGSDEALEILVYDDNSTDQTALQVQALSQTDARIRLLPGQPLPDGWLGKPYALHQLAQAAKGDWLLYLDADVRLHPGAIQAAVTYAQEEQLDALSLIGDRDKNSFWTQIWEPLWPCLLHYLIGPITAIGQQPVGRVFASGAWFLIHRFAYTQAGGWRTARASICEDCAFAKRIVAAGYRYQLCLGEKVYALRMYSSLKEILAGWRKNAYPVFLLLGGKPLEFAALLTAVLILTLGPLAPLCAGLAMGRHPLQASGAAYYLPLFLSLLGSLSLRIVCGVAPHWFFLLPLSGALMLYVLCDSASRVILRRPVQWKGRTYRGGKPTSGADADRPVRKARIGTHARLMLAQEQEGISSWMTLGLQLGNGPALGLPALRRAVHAIYAETPYLQVAREGSYFISAPYAASNACIDITSPQSLDSLLRCAITTPISWSHATPLRIFVAANRFDPEKLLLVCQLHHALGDGASLLALFQRLCQYLNHTAEVNPPLTVAPALGRSLLFACLKKPSCVARLFHGRYRLSARRGLRLPIARVAAPAGLGPPVYCAIRITGAPRQSSFSRRGARLFYALLLSAIADWAEPSAGLLRFRISVDLRPLLGIGRVLGNVGTAIAVEIPLPELRAQLGNCRFLENCIPEQIKKQIQLGIPIATALECRLAALLPMRLLAEAESKDLLQSPRTNTLVITYLGEFDAATASGLEIHDLRAHAPTWGATAFLYSGALHITVNSFAGLWSDTELTAFAQRIAVAAQRLYGAQTEVV